MAESKVKWLGPFEYKGIRYKIAVVDHRIVFGGKCMNRACAHVFLSPGDDQKSQRLSDMAYKLQDFCTGLTDFLGASTLSSKYDDLPDVDSHIKVAHELAREDIDSLFKCQITLEKKAEKCREEYLDLSSKLKEALSD